MDTIDSKSIIHPGHYNTSKYECWDVWKSMVEDYKLDPIEATYLFNALKYLWRYSQKGTPEKDLNKSKNYIDEMLKYIANKGDN